MRLSFPHHSASGKSHFGLQLALTAQLPSCSAEPGGAILLTSERKISFTRLEQIAQSRLPGESSTMAINTKRYLDNVHTMHVTEVDGLEHALAYMVPNVIDSSAALSASIATSRSIQTPARLPISLIVIDSIGALFRASYDSNQGGLSQRSRMLCVLADRLKHLAHKYNIAVVVVNQVSDVFGSADGPSRISRPNSPALVSDAGRGSPIPDGVQPTMTYKVQSQYFSGQTKSLPKEASLGLVWANAVNVRIMLSRTGRRRPLDAQDLSRRIKRPRTVDGRYRKDLDEEEQRTRKAANVPNVAPTENISAEPSFEATLIRRMHLVFSPSAKQDSLDYVILQSGIHSLPPADYSANGENGETSTSVIPGYQAQPTREAADDDFQNEVFDDLGNLPVDFWTSEAFNQMQEEAQLDGSTK